MLQQNVRVFRERLALVTIIPSQMEGIIKLDPSSHACKCYIFHLCFRNRYSVIFCHPSYLMLHFFPLKIEKNNLSKHLTNAFNN